MKHEYRITFSYWRIKPEDPFSMTDLEDSIETITRAKTIRAETQQQATTRLQKSWSIPIKILSIKEQYNERERTM